MAKDRLDQIDYYKLLRVRPDASDDEIKQAFRLFALKYHPDRHPPATPRARRAVEIYRRGSEAFRTLSDGKLRAIYDQELKKGNLRLDRRKARLEVTPKISREDQIADAYLKPTVEQAEKALLREDWEGAAQLLRAALKLDPKNEELRSKLAEAIAKLNGSEVKPR